MKKVMLVTGNGDLLVSISQTSELLLSRCVPNVELNGTQIGEEFQWVHFHTKRGLKNC